MLPPPRIERHLREREGAPRRAVPARWRAWSVARRLPGERICETEFVNCVDAAAGMASGLMGQGEREGWRGWAGRRYKLIAARVISPPPENPTFAPSITWCVLAKNREWAWSTFLVLFFITVRVCTAPLFGSHELGPMVVSTRDCSPLIPDFRGESTSTTK